MQNLTVDPTHPMLVRPVVQKPQP